MRFTIVFAVVALLLSITATADDSDEPPDSRLTLLTREAVAWNPRVQAAQEEVTAFLAAHRSLREFFDPQVFAAGGTARDHRLVPGATGAPSVVDDSATAESGVERAFAPGFYGSVGAAYRYRWDATSEEDDITQSFVGAQLRVPLWRDRGFREFDLGRQQTYARFLAAHSRVRAAIEALQHDVALAYIDLQEQYALWEAATDALARVETLLKEAQELVRLKVVPEYQLHQAELEVVLRQEEELAAREALDLARIRLHHLTGREISLETDVIASQELVSWAQLATVDLDLPFEESLRQRGAWLDLLHRTHAAEAATALAQEQLKGDLSLRAAVTWQGDSAERGIDNERIVTDNNVGGSVQLVYSRPLFQTGARERAREQAALLATAEEQLRDEEIVSRSGLLEARRSFQTARQRLGLASAGVTLARQTLEAESERFRLGEALSRDVLDAQQDLTNTVRLQSSNAARLLRARADHRFWTGYLPADLFTQTEPPREEPSP